MRTPARTRSQFLRKVISPWLAPIVLAAAAACGNEPSTQIGNTTGIAREGMVSFATDAAAVDGDGGYQQQAIFTSSTSFFGTGLVTMDDGLVVIGNSELPIYDASEGVVQTYVPTEDGGWNEETNLVVDSGIGQFYFGRSLASAGTTLVVGAPYKTTADGGVREGAVYVFSEADGGWSAPTEVDVDGGRGPVAGPELGISVAMSNGTLFVGAAYYSYEGLYNVGAVLTYVEDGGAWTQSGILESPFETSGHADAAGEESFGQILAASDGLAIVGMTGYEVTYDAGVDGAVGLTTGAAFIFGRDDAGTWTSQAELVPGDGLTYTGGGFGYSVAIQGSTAIVGSLGYVERLLDGGVVTPGAAYVFTSTDGGWTQQAQLVANDGRTSDRFGSTVALNGNTALIGAPYRQVGSNTTEGTVYVFVNDAGTWTQTQELTPSNGATNQGFGGNLWLGDGSALIEGTGQNGDELYAVYRFVVPGLNGGSGGGDSGVDSGSSGDSGAGDSGTSDSGTSDSGGVGMGDASEDATSTADASGDASGFSDSGSGKGDSGSGSDSGTGAPHDGGATEDAGNQDASIGDASSDAAEYDAAANEDAANEDAAVGTGTTSKSSSCSCGVVGQEPETGNAGALFGLGVMALGVVARRRKK